MKEGVKRIKSMTRRKRKIVISDRGAGFPMKLNTKVPEAHVKWHIPSERDGAC